MDEATLDKLDEQFSKALIKLSDMIDNGQISKTNAKLVVKEIWSRDKSLRRCIYEEKETNN